MKRRLKKCQICFCILLLVLGFFCRPKPVKADAGVLTGGGLLISTLNPAAIPIILIGLAACLLLGYTITNWDDIAAFGQAVANELRVMGHGVGEFISGTSVKVNTTFKEAVKRVANAKTDTIAPYSDNKKVYTGSICTNIGLQNTTAVILASVLSGTGDLALVLGNYDIGKGDIARAKNKINIQTLTVSVRFQPVDDKYHWNLELDGYSGQRYAPSSANVIRDANAKMIGIDAVYDYKKSKARSVGLYLRSKGAGSSNIDVTSVSIPELGINKSSAPVSLQNMKTGAVSSQKIDEYVETAFPESSTTVTFGQNADVTGATLATIPNISNHTLTDAQVQELTEIKTGTTTNTGIDSAVGTVSGAPTANIGAGWDWLSKLWEWLKKLLDAILGIPVAILKGLQALWDSLIKWLTKIWTAITAIPGAISKAWTDGLSWAFGVEQTWLNTRLKSLRIAFNSKFPNIQAFNYNFNDKVAFDDIRITLPVFGTHSIVSGSAMTAFAVKVKPFISGIFYLLTALFFMRKFYKVSED